MNALNRHIYRAIYFGGAWTNNQQRLNRVRGAKRAGTGWSGAKKSRKAACAVAGASLKAQWGGGQRCLREPINHSSRIKGSKDEKRRQTVGRTASKACRRPKREREREKALPFVPSVVVSLRSPSLPPPRPPKDHFLFCLFSKFVGRFYCRGPREKRERLSRTRLNPWSDQRSFRRGEDSLTDNAILSSVVLLLKMISRHENWPREGFWTPVGTQCT